MQTIYNKLIKSDEDIIRVKQMLTELYKTKSLIKISKHLNTPIDTLRRYFDLLQIKFRSRSESVILSYNDRPPTKHSIETKLKMSSTAKLIGKQQGTKNSQFGTRWITNGNQSKKIKATDPVPMGWHFGR